MKLKTMLLGLSVMTALPAFAQKPVYLDTGKPIEERVKDALNRMTLEEKILQTDQYYSGDFTTQDENGKVTAVDMQRFDALMQHNSVGSVQLRGMTAVQANVVQR